MTARSAADASGKTAEKSVGVGRCRSCASPPGLRGRPAEARHRTTGLHPACRRAAQGTGEARDAARPDGHHATRPGRHLRRSEDLLADVADASSGRAGAARLQAVRFRRRGAGQPAERWQRRSGPDARARPRPRYRARRAPGARCRAGPDRARHALSGDLGQPDPSGARGGAGDRRPVELARRCRRQGGHRLGAPVRCSRGEEPPHAPL